MSLLQKLINKIRKPKPEMPCLAEPQSINDQDQLIDKTKLFKLLRDEYGEDNFSVSLPYWLKDGVEWRRVVYTISVRSDADSQLPLTEVCVLMTCILQGNERETKLMRVGAN